MLRTELRPTRTTVGRTLTPLIAREIGRSPAAEPLQIQLISRATLDDARIDPLYRALLPNDIEVGNPPAIMSPALIGTNFPPPSVLPVDAATPCVSVIAFATEVIEADISRRLWVDFEFLFDSKNPPTIGGICYGGYPGLPYYVNAFGENSANFGLPREIRLSWEQPSMDGFVDADSSVTEQEPTSHSGVHVLSTGPIVANRLVVRFSDFPRLLYRTRADGGNVEVTERWGLIVPYLYFFEYAEGTRYEPRVPGGVLAAVQVPPRFDGGFFDPLPPVGANAGSPSAPYRYASADTILPAVNDPASYLPQSAGCLFDQRRVYAYNIITGTPTVEEYFASGALKPDDEVRIIIEQAEEDDRCLAAVKLDYPHWVFDKNNQLPDALQIDLDIYELDPPEGVSPLDMRRPLRSDRYARRLFTREAVEPDPDGVVCRFVRPSTSRYFVLVFRCRAAHPTRVVLRRIELVQSAHVDVVQRPSRSQSLRAMRFRLVGPSLADDYARLGPDGFGFSVEHIVAGERKSVLFQASSLTELLRATDLRINANHRFKETRVESSDEASQLLPGCYQVQRLQARAEGWNHAETGKGVEPYVPEYWNQISPLFPEGHHGMQAFSNAESRVQSRQLEPAAAAPNADLNDFVGKINSMAAGAGITVPPLVVLGPALVAGFGPGGLDWESIWKGTLVRADASVEGLTVFTVPPILGEAIDIVNKAAHGLRTLQDLMNANGNTINPFDPATALTLQQMIVDMQNELLQMGLAMTPMAWINGVNVSLNGGMGLAGSVTGTGGILVLEGSAGASLSGNLGAGMSVNYSLPTMTRSFTIGTTGAVNKQASLTGYSYALHKTTRYDDTWSRVDQTEGATNRRSTRTIDLEGRDQVRSRGAEVMWRGDYADVIVGTVPLNLVLPATAGKMYQGADEAVRVRLLNGMPAGLSMDVAFDVIEEVVRDDY